MTPDPALFLSTIVLASGALVAIIGGLLVARFVGLDADQQTNRRVLIAADGRLAAARRRANDARRSLVHWDAWDFFSKPDVLDAIGRGESDPTEVRRLAPCFLDEEDLQRVMADVVSEFAHAREVLPGRISSEDYDWNKFKKSASDLPYSGWPMAWEHVFEEIVRDRKAEQNSGRQKAREVGLKWSMDSTPWLQLSDPPDLRGISTGYDLRRRDDLAAAYERTEQRVEDYEDELRRLRDEHAEIIRPDKRLWIGVIILAAFAGLGVAWPMYAMSTGPTELVKVQWFVWPFCGVLAALVIYVVLYLGNLSRRQLPSIADIDEEN